MAPAGADGQKALQLLAAAKKLGAATIGTITAKALKRQLSGQNFRGVTKVSSPFFNDSERRQLQKALAATTATAELLGRARIRRRQEQAQRHESFAETPRLEPYRARVINAMEFRAKDLAHQEFGLWATRYDFPEIPENEVWLADRTSPSDRRYFLFNAEAYRKARRKGMDADEAYDYALAAERSERERNRLGGHGGDFPSHDDAFPGMYVKPWKTIEQDEERVEVWFVNGERVREALKTDWTEGGHAYVYPYIPENEIWIEAGLRPEEATLTLLHEFTERRLMKHEELGYDDAHDEASRVEFAGRQKADAFSEATDFSEVATDFSCFDETAGPLRPLAPTDAIAYFKRLVPRLDIDIAAFNGHIEGESFRMAQATEQQVLERCQSVIGKILEQGEGLDASPRQVDQILHEAGVHPKNPQYAEMVVRTNLMNSYTQGSHDELQEVSDDFPWYRYVGIRDGRQRKRHEKWFDKYFEAAVPFDEVRDHEAGEYDGFNCRCDLVPIYKAQVAQLKARGVQVTPWPGNSSAYAEFDEWITIGGAPEGDKKHVGGTHVRIGDRGQIKAGPPALKGKNLPRTKPAASQPRPVAKSVAKPAPSPAKPQLAQTSPVAKPVAVPHEKGKLPKAGPSKAKIEIGKHMNLRPAQAKRIADNMAKSIWGRKGNVDNFATLVGAPDDATVYVTPINAHTMRVLISSDNVHAIRNVYYAADGEKWIDNEYFEVKGEKGKGVGAAMFSKQASSAQDSGFEYIMTHAAGSAKDPKYNGYYTWARFGYDQPLTGSFEKNDVGKKAMKAFPKAQTVQDVMSTPEGRAWWKKNGAGIRNAVFNLAPGSRSMEVLSAYLEERQAAAAHGEGVADAGPIDIDLSPEDEAALERAWKKLDAKRAGHG